jgi:cell division protein FtsQ
MVKLIIKIILLLAVVSYLIFATLITSQNNNEHICIGTEILIDNKVEKNYISKNYIENILKNTKITIKNQNIDSININIIEEQLRACPFVDSVICYYTPQYLLCIKIQPCQPIVQVIANNGDNYYMDINGNIMPSNIFPLDICLATGHITKQYAKENVLKVADFLNTSKRWSKEIQQIYITQNGEIEFVPLTGEHKIIIGEPEELAEKLNRLEVFYKQGLDKAGWNKYSCIDLSYSNQIVCTKKEQK